MFYVYILFSSKDKLLYTGFTPNIRSRLKAHNGGYVKSTQHRLPIKLIYCECYVSELDARRREIYLKGGKGKSELKKQLIETFRKISYLKREII